TSDTISNICMLLCPITSTQHVYPFSFCLLNPRNSSPSCDRQSSNLCNSSQGQVLARLLLASSCPLQRV
ncbi:hypothetical protein HispidOSU_023972, partial [Sigmodon hispidus]